MIWLSKLPVYLDDTAMDNTVVNKGLPITTDRWLMLHNYREHLVTLILIHSDYYSFEQRNKIAKEILSVERALKMSDQTPNTK